MQILSKNEVKIFLHFHPPLKLREEWVISLSRYFKHGLGPISKMPFTTGPIDRRAICPFLEGAFIPRG